MKRLITATLELGLGAFLLLLGASIAYASAGTLDEVISEFTRADLFTLIGAAVGVTGIAAVVRGTSNLIRGSRRG